VSAAGSRRRSRWDEAALTAAKTMTESQPETNESHEERSELELSAHRAREDAAVLASGKVACSPSSPRSQELPAAPGGSARSLALRCARQPAEGAVDGAEGASGGVFETRVERANEAGFMGHDERVVDPSPVANATSTPTRSTAHKTGAEERSTMRRVALDLGAKKIAFCEVENGQVIDRATVRSLSGLNDRIGPNTPPARVLFEAGRSSWHVHDELVKAGHEPIMLDTTRARQLGIGQHRKKTDRIDAETLARALELGSVPAAHVLSPARRELRYHIGIRRQLVEMRASTVTTIREVVRSRGHGISACSTDAFLVKLNETPLDEATRALVAPLATSLEVLALQIYIVNAKLEQLCAEDPIVNVLKTAPGVGPIVAAAFVSVLDDAGRFRNAHQVEAYLGVVPGENSSGGKRRLGGITKQGNGYLRAVLTQSAWSILRSADPEDPLRLWGEAIAKRRGTKIAIIALARRLAGVLWAMWRRNAVYDPQKVGKASAQGIDDSARALAKRAKALKLAATKGRNPKPKTKAVHMS